MDMSSDDFESDIASEAEDEQGLSESSKIQRIDPPSTFYRYVRQLVGRHSRTRMKSDELYVHRFLEQYLQLKHIPGCMEDLLDDSPVEENHSLDGIRAKTEEYDRQQLKGVQLANAGSNNLKIVNSYSVTSSTCALM